MEKEFVTPITHLEEGESIYFPLPCFMKSIPTAMAAYNTVGTVVKTSMDDEGQPTYALVFFPAIDGHQMLPRTSLVRKADGSVICCHCHDIDESNEYSSCDCAYTSIAK